MSTERNCLFGTIHTWRDPVLRKGRR